MAERVGFEQHRGSKTRKLLTLQIQRISTNLSFGYPKHKLAQADWHQSMTKVEAMEPDMNQLDETDDYLDEV